jgi:hypothetical protein
MVVIPNGRRAPRCGRESATRSHVPRLLSASTRASTAASGSIASSRLPASFRMGGANPTSSDPASLSRANIRSGAESPSLDTKLRSSSSLAASSEACCNFNLRPGQSGLPCRARDSAASAIARAFIVSRSPLKSPNKCAATMSTAPYVSGISGVGSSLRFQARICSRLAQARFALGLTRVATTIRRASLVSAPDTSTLALRAC